MAVLLPIILVYCMYQSKQMCSKNFAKLVNEATIMRHVFFAI